MRKSLMLLCLLAFACEKPAEKKEKPAPPPSASTAEAPSATASAPAASASATAAKTVELEVSAKASTMAFDQTALSVPTGAKVHLTFENKKPGALPHNWALVMPGTEAKVAAAGLKAGEAKSYITKTDDLLAYTELVKPGAKGEVTFTAPAAGKYPYICTYPGHYVMMHGVLTVTP
jgi:azurin